MIIIISLLVVVTVFLTINYIDLSARYSYLEERLQDISFNNDLLDLDLSKVNAKLNELTPKKPVKNVKVKTK